MTNLDIIKYLAINNPSRLAELLEDIYCCGWNDGANDKLGEESTFSDFNKWLHEDPVSCGLYYDDELQKWATFTITDLPTKTCKRGLRSKLPLEDSIAFLGTKDDLCKEITEKLIDMSNADIERK